jgi:hypothetical protein
MTKKEYMRKRERIMMEMEEHIPSQEIAIFFARRIADLEEKYRASKKGGTHGTF